MAIVKMNGEDQFRELLDIIYADLALDYDHCKLKDWDHFSFPNIPVTLEPNELKQALKERKPMDYLRFKGITLYSPEFLCLSRISELLESHSLGKESWPGGHVTSNFEEALGKLDELEGSNQYFLVEDVGRNGLLTLVSNARLWPSLNHVRYVPGNADYPKFDVRLVVELSPELAIDIGKNHIVPYFYGHNPSRNIKKAPVCLLGYRTNPQDEPHININEGSHSNYRLHTGSREVWGIIRERVSKNMYGVVREVSKENFE